MKTFSFAAFVVLLAVMLVIPVKAQMGRMSIDDRVKLLEKELTLTKDRRAGKDKGIERCHAGC
jgi:hypothetical protein